MLYSQLPYCAWQKGHGGVFTFELNTKWFSPPSDAFLALLKSFPVFHCGQGQMAFDLSAPDIWQTRMVAKPPTVVGRNRLKPELDCCCAIAGAWQPRGVQEQQAAPVCPSWLLGVRTHTHHLFYHHGRCYLAGVYRFGVRCLVFS